MKSRRARARGVAGQVDVGRHQPGADDAGDGRRAARPRSSSTTPGPTASCAPARTRSRAARPRSSRTSSPSECWGCRADELRPDRGPARDQAHRARLARRALPDRARCGDRAGRRAPTRTGTRSSSSAGPTSPSFGMVELAVVAEELGLRAGADAAGLALGGAAAASGAGGRAARSRCGTRAAPIPTRVRRWTA